jgi:CRISPR-associated exonuclease Cas4
MEYITISSISHYDYCPRSAWYLIVGREALENIHVVEGKLLHERVDSAERTVRRDLVQGRTVPLYSDKYGLIGITDLVEERNGDWYPVEYKKGREGEWRNHHIQLCAQALCLEEMLCLSQSIRRGFIYYAASGKRKEVRLDKKLRTTTIQIIEATRKLLDTKKPPAVKYGPKCQECSLYPICLPKEIETINKRKWWR